MSDGIRFFAAAPTLAASSFAHEVEDAGGAPDADPIAALKEIVEAELTLEESLKEASLYPNVLEFLADIESTLGIRVNESRSANRRGRNGNKWLHPDIDGMIVPDLAWTRIVRDCSRQLPTRRAKLISVEVKVRLTSGDIREAFFQTVSNSQWANRAYLAATEVRGADTWRELEMLCALHGVGYIRLDHDDALAGRILIPAREREEVDWASANRIAEENDDFRRYLGAVLNYLQSGDVVPSLWDRSPPMRRATTRFD